MKTLEQQIAEVLNRLDALENNLTDRAETITFTKAELVEFASRLIGRTATACKEVVNEIEFESEYICELSLGHGNQIEIEIDHDVIRDTIANEIDGTIEFDYGTIENEVDYVLNEILEEKQS